MSEADPTATTATTVSRRQRLVAVLAAAVLVPLLAGVLYAYPPAEYSFYPRCLFFVMTGWHCPGCGATRCVHALLRGDLGQALGYNALFVLLLPLIGLWVAHVGYLQWTGRPLVKRRWPTWAIGLLVALVAAFGVLRNVPVYPLTLLAPHAP
jgi:hypothetical protein